MVRVLCRSIVRLLVKGSCLGKKKDREDGSEDYGKSRSDSEERILLELRSEFEVDKSALHYIRAVEDYQRTTTTKIAVHTALVDVVIYFSVCSVIGESV